MNPLYHTILLDHYRYSRYRGTLANPDFSSELHNPSCGDSVLFQGKMSGQVVMSLAFTGSGCVISQATASLLAQAAMGRPTHEIMSFDTVFIIGLIQMELGPTRLKCALLPLEALHQGIGGFRQDCVSQC